MSPAGLFWLARRFRLPRVPATLGYHSGFFRLCAFYRLCHARSAVAVDGHALLDWPPFYRERNPLNTIGFAALCLLAYSPRKPPRLQLPDDAAGCVVIGGVAAPLLESTVHPYLTATRDLRQIALDNKLPPRQAHSACFSE